MATYQVYQSSHLLVFPVLQMVFLHFWLMLCKCGLLFKVLIKFCHFIKIYFLIQPYVTSIQFCYCDSGQEFGKFHITVNLITHCGLQCCWNFHCHRHCRRLSPTRACCIIRELYPTCSACCQQDQIQHQCNSFAVPCDRQIQTICKYLVMPGYSMCWLSFSVIKVFKCLISPSFYVLQEMKECHYVGRP